MAWERELGSKEVIEVVVGGGEKVKKMKSLVCESWRRKKGYFFMLWFLPLELVKITLFYSRNFCDCCTGDEQVDDQVGLQLAAVVPSFSFFLTFLLLLSLLFLFSFLLCVGPFLFVGLSPFFVC